MPYQTLKNIKRYYLDSADPDSKALHIAVRGSLACFISIILFQYIGQNILAGWAGFAALAFTQIDTLEIISKRVKFLAGNIFVFTVLALIGIGLSNYVLWFILTIPFVIFACAYISCLGEQYYNAGGWAGFLYVAFGSSLGDISHAVEVAITFIAVGILCILISIIIFPEIPLIKINKSFKRILIKLHTLYHISNNVHRQKITHQLENLIAIQNTTINTYLAAAKLSAVEENSIINASKTIQQIVLMLKSIDAFTPQLSMYSSSPIELFQNCRNTTLELIENSLKLLNTQIIKPSNTDLIISKYRDDLKVIQKQELNQIDPNFALLLDYSSHLYHFIKLWQTFTILCDDLSCFNTRKLS